MFLPTYPEDCPHIWKNLVRFPNPLLEVGWDYTAPIGGEFFFPPFQHSQLLTKMASRVLIGFLNITGSHMLKHDVCSLTCLAAYTPFLSSTRMQLLLEAVVRVGFLIFYIAFIFLTGSNFAFSAQRSAIFVSICAGIVVGFVTGWISYFQDLF